MSIKARVLRAESNIKGRKEKPGRIVLVFTDNKAGTTEIHAGNEVLFTGTIEEGKRFVKALNLPTVYLPDYDPRWCA